MSSHSKGKKTVNIIPSCPNPTGCKGLSSSVLAAALQSRYVISTIGPSLTTGPKTALRKQQAKWEKQIQINSKIYTGSSKASKEESKSSAPLSDERATINALLKSPNRMEYTLEDKVAKSSSTLGPLFHGNGGGETLALAQRLGILPSIPTPSKIDWPAMQAKSMTRRDMTEPCPICVEPFLYHPNQQHVLLSCTHLFHKACLESYERYSGRVACPLCRHPNYEKRIVLYARDWAVLSRIIKIQSWWRMCSARKQYDQYQILNPPKHPLLLQRWKVAGAVRLSRQLELEAKLHDQERIELMRHIDLQVFSSRDIMQKTIKAFEDLAVESTVDLPEARPPSPELNAFFTAAQIQPEDGTEWNAIYMRLLERGTNHEDHIDCAICLCPLLLNSNPSKPVALLSCSHAFHSKCLTRMEAFRCGLDYVETTSESFNTGNSSCPCCRSVYTKIVI